MWGAGDVTAGRRKRYRLGVPGAFEQGIQCLRAPTASSSFPSLHVLAIAQSRASPKLNVETHIPSRYRPFAHRFQIGYLRAQNRIIVSLSRARRGMYIIGNRSLLFPATEGVRTLPPPLLRWVQSGETTEPGDRRALFPPSPPSSSPLPHPDLRPQRRHGGGFRGVAPSDCQLAPDGWLGKRVAAVLPAGLQFFATPPAPLTSPLSFRPLPPRRGA